MSILWYQDIPINSEILLLLLQLVLSTEREDIVQVFLNFVHLFLPIQIGYKHVEKKLAMEESGDLGWLTPFINTV